MSNKENDSDQSIMGFKKHSRRTVLKHLGVGAITTSSVATTSSAFRHPNRLVTPTQADLFTDEFEDGDFKWTVSDHSEFWSEKNGRAHYNPSSSVKSIGDNHAYADATFSGDQGELTWPLAIEFKAYASDTSAQLGAFAAVGGPKDSVTPRLGVGDGKYKDEFTAWNSEGERFTLTNARDNNEWYTYGITPDIKNNVVRISRNNESWTIPEPNNQPIDNLSVVLSGQTCWGCGGNGDRKYEYIHVEKVPLAGDQGATDLPIPMDALSPMLKTVDSLREPWTTTAWQAARRLSQQLMGHARNMLKPSVEDALPGSASDFLQIVQSTKEAFEILANQQTNLSRERVRTHWDKVHAANLDLFAQNYDNLGYNTSSKRVLNQPYLPLFTAIRDDLGQARRTQSDSVFSTLNSHAASVDTILTLLQLDSVTIGNQQTKAFVLNLKSYHQVVKTIRNMTT